MNNLRSCLLLFAVFLTAPTLRAQIGEYRNEFAVGVNGGLSMSKVSFTPEVPQDQFYGKTFGFTFRYNGEKYFKSICSVVAEVNFTEMGWRERIWDVKDQPVINQLTGEAEEYSRVVNYVQVPFFARLGWGRERRGIQVFFQIGPQLGLYLSEKTKANFDLDHPNSTERVSRVSGPNIGQSTYSNMYHKPIENKLDYGIAGGLGIELSLPSIGHFLVEGRYYFGLGNIYGNSKRDYFAKSNYQTIQIKAAYLFDLIKSNNPKIK